MQKCGYRGQGKIFESGYCGRTSITDRASEAASADFTVSYVILKLFKLLFCFYFIF